MNKIFILKEETNIPIFHLKKKEKVKWKKM